MISIQEQVRTIEAAESLFGGKTMAKAAFAKMWSNEVTSYINQELLELDYLAGSPALQNEQDEENPFDRDEDGIQQGGTC